MEEIIGTILMFVVVIGPMVFGLLVFCGGCYIGYKLAKKFFAWLG